jgi:hypothetical protein
MDAEKLLQRMQRDVLEANAKLDKAQARRTKYESTKATIDVVRKKIKPAGQEALAGQKALDKAYARLKEGLLPKALEHAEDAEKQHAIAQALLPRLRAVRSRIQKHLNKCSMKEDKLNELKGLLNTLGDTETRMKEVDFDPTEEAQFRSSIEDVEGDFVDHLQQHDAPPIGPWSKLEELFSGLPESEIGKALVGVMSEDQSGDLIELRGALQRLDTWDAERRTEQLAVRCVTEERFRRIDEPIRFELWDERLLARRFKETGDVEWAVEPAQGKYTITDQTDDKKGHAAVLTFQEEGQYTVHATMSGREIEPTRVRIDNPLFSLECSTDPSDRRVEEDVVFKVKLEHTTTGLGRRGYSYKWTIRKRGKATSEKPPTKPNRPTISYVFDSEGWYTVSVIVNDDRTGFNDTELELELRVRISWVSELRLRSRRRKLWALAISAGIALLGGSLAIKAFAPTFGSLQEYLIAMLWGAGVQVTAAGASWGILTAPFKALVSGAAGKKD